MLPRLCVFDVPLSYFYVTLKLQQWVCAEEWQADLITGCPCQWHIGEMDTHTHNPHCSRKVTIHLDSSSTHRGEKQASSSSEVTLCAQKSHVHN